MLWRILICVFALCVGIAFWVHHALTRTQISTVADIRTREDTGVSVALQGRVVCVEDSRFVLDDGTGRAEIATCPAWYKPINICVGERVIVMGRVLKTIRLGRTRSEFVVSAYRILRDGEVIEVRGKPGKPPWAYQRVAGEPASPP